MGWSYTSASPMYLQRHFMGWPFLPLSLPLTVPISRATKWPCVLKQQLHSEHLLFRYTTSNVEIKVYRTISRFVCESWPLILRDGYTDCVKERMHKRIYESSKLGNDRNLEKITYWEAPQFVRVGDHDIVRCTGRVTSMQHTKNV